MMGLVRNAAIGAFLLAGTSAQGADPIRIGVIADMSGPYADLAGPGFVTAVKMAVEDFGGTVLNRPVEVLSADDQAKADIAVRKAREWYDRQSVEAIFEGSNSATAIALQRLGMERKKVTVLFSGTQALTNDECSPYGIHYAWDTYSLANGTATAVTKAGGKSWFFLTADYTFGKSMQDQASAAITRLGGEVVGGVRHPLNSPDFASFLLVAQQSGAKVVALANGGRDTQNSIRQASEFNLQQKQKIVPLLVFDTDIKAMGLDQTQGLMYTSAFYWDFDDQTREFSRRFFARHKGMPTMNHAGVYSATMHYLRAVKAANTLQSEAVMAEMKKSPVNDFFGRGGIVRNDGRMVHDMYLVEVKKPSESREPWDIAKVVQTIPGKEAFASLETGSCAFAKSAAQGKN
jgi:branched-chain amino acid transport system substrate-binding protein